MGGRVGGANGWPWVLAMACGALMGPLSGVEGQIVGGDGGSDPAPIPGAPTSPAVFPVSVARSPIRIDGVLDEAAWTEAVSIPLPFEINPGDNTPSRYRTDCRVTFDDSHLYLGCAAFDPDPSSIRAYITDRDRILGNHDRISFLVDPFDDLRRGWVFEVSALGVQADLTYDERTSAFDTSWDAIWSSAGRITDDGYSIEAAIPFGSLRFPSSSDPQTWRFWINRMRPRDQTVTMRSNTRLRDESCQLCQAHALAGFQGMDPGRNAEIVPTLTASRVDARPDGLASPMTAGEVAWEAGIDARWSLTTDLTLNATLNPDFSQIEADAPQLSANSRFALFFPEKRPFFLEGADLFSTPIRAVFTRSVSDPVGGAKFSGKSGPHGIGVLVARDRVNNLLVPGDLGSRRISRDEEVTASVLRYRRDVGDGATVGTVVTAREGTDGYRGWLGGVDAYVRPHPTLGVNLQVLASRTRYGSALSTEADLPEAPFGGTAYMADASWNTGDWGAFAGLNVREAGFRADAGFVPQVDTRSVWANVARTFWGGSDALFPRVSARTGFWRDRTLSDRLIGEGVWAQIDFEGPLQSNGWLNPWTSREYFDGRSYDIEGLNIGLGFRPTPDLRLAMNGTFGDAIDFRNGRAARSVRLNPNLELRLGRNVELQASHGIQRLTVDGERILTENAGQLQAAYNFSPRAFVRTTVQYRRTDRNPATNPELDRTIEESLATQALFSYKVNPLTVVFLGVSDDRLSFEEHLGARVGLTPRGRTFFLKLGYAWRP